MESAMSDEESTDTSSEEPQPETAAPEAGAPEAPPEEAAPEEALEEEAPPEDQLEEIYARASACYQPLWLMSRSRIPWDDQAVKEAKSLVREMEAAIRDTSEDYEAFRRLWRQDRATLSDPLRLVGDEIILRNLADLQDDLLRTLARRDPNIVDVSALLEANAG